MILLDIIESLGSDKHYIFTQRCRYRVQIIIKNRNGLTYYIFLHGSISTNLNHLFLCTRHIIVYVYTLRPH